MVIFSFSVVSAALVDEHHHKETCTVKNSISLTALKMSGLGEGPVSVTLCTVQGLKETSSGFQHLGQCI